MAKKNDANIPQDSGDETPDGPVKKRTTSSTKKTTPAAGTRGRKKLDNAEEKVEAVARKARTTAKKVAAAVSETVKEIAEKVSAKKPRTRTVKAEGSSASKPAGRLAVKKSASSKTKAGALSADMSDEEIRNALSDMPSSESIRSEDDISEESPTDVREHYFHDQHVHAGPPPPQPPRDLPDEYDDTKLVLLVRDPEWVYAYWEINDATRQELDIPRDGHQNRMVLRMFKITGRQWPNEAAHYFFDVDVNNDARSWYVRLPEPNESWCAELGIVDDEQNYIAVCRSNQFITPRNSLSDHVDSDWMIVEESFEKITRLSGADMAARLRGESHTASESILKHIHRQLTGVLHGERAALSSGLFASEAAIPPVGKDFWLQVHTELILYGATEPDARVTVQGQPVVLNPDGTFSIRFSLPDGEQVLEVRARNNAGDMEEVITPVVVRTTR